MSKIKRTTAFYAITAGLGACGGSLFGKLSGIPDHLLLKCIFFVLMLVLNTVGLTFFVKALQYTNSSLTATVICTATNYFCSAGLGFLFFGEVTSVLWWCGMLLVLMGLFLISKSQSSTEEEHKKAA